MTISHAEFMAKVDRGSARSRPEYNPLAETAETRDPDELLWFLCDILSATGDDSGERSLAERTASAVKKIRHMRHTLADMAEAVCIYAGNDPADCNVRGY